jgi:RNA polymerase sigma-70 factor (ECF subfamily)
MLDLEDNKLVAKIKEGDQKSFEKIIKKYKTQLYPFILKYINNPNDSYDIIQEVFTKVYFNINSFNPSKALFKTWLYTIAINLCKDYKKKKRLQKAIPFMINDSEKEEGFSMEKLIVSDDISTENELINSQESKKLVVEINKLPDKIRIPLILFYLEEKSYKEVAEILKISTKAVEMKVYRAKKILENRLKKL